MWNAIRLRLFLFFRMPAAYFAGIRLLSCDGDTAIVAIRYNWWTRNPFGSVYFACLAMAAEFSTGILAWSVVRNSGLRFSMLVADFQASFIKKSTGKVSFQCSDGELISSALASLKQPDNSIRVTTHSEGRNEAGELTCRFSITWHFKRK